MKEYNIYHLKVKQKYHINGIKLLMERKAFESCYIMEISSIYESMGKRHLTDFNKKCALILWRYRSIYVPVSIDTAILYRYIKFNLRKCSGMGTNNLIKNIFMFL